MESITIGRKRYSDPDVISLIRETGSLIDPRSSVVSLARRLHEYYRILGGVTPDPFLRLRMMASLRGFDVIPMDRPRQQAETRDAVIVLTGGSRNKKGQILFNPERPKGRINFSIAHEIAHTFFPNTLTGARFRSICSAESREANELEHLCDCAASEILMPVEEFQQAAGVFSLSVTGRLAEEFGSSFEATAFRLATAHPGIACAGLLRYRLKVGEERAVEIRRRRLEQQQVLFNLGESPCSEFKPFYRRQSFFCSYSFDEARPVPWNKSFAENSCVYQLPGHGVVTAREALPVGGCPEGRIEAVRAPFQRDPFDPDHPDVLFFWALE